VFAGPSHVKQDESHEAQETVLSIYSLEAHVGKVRHSPRYNCLVLESQDKQLDDDGPSHVKQVESQVAQFPLVLIYSFD